MNQKIKSIPCELCCSNIIRGIVHKINSQYICDDCKTKLEDSEGIYFDGKEEEKP